MESLSEKTDIQGTAEFVVLVQPTFLCTLKNTQIYLIKLSENLRGLHFLLPWFSEYGYCYCPLTIKYGQRMTKASHVDHMGTKYFLLWLHCAKVAIPLLICRFLGSRILNEKVTSLKFVRTLVLSTFGTIYPWKSIVLNC